MSKMKNQKMIAQQNMNRIPSVESMEKYQKSIRIHQETIFNLTHKSNYLIKLREMRLIDSNQANKRLATECRSKANKKIALSVKSKGGWLRKSHIT